MKSIQQNKFEIFEDSNRTEHDKFCPVCEESLVLFSFEYLFCEKCKSKVLKRDAMDDVSIEYIFGTKGG